MSQVLHADLSAGISGVQEALWKGLRTNAETCLIIYVAISQKFLVLFLLDRSKLCLHHAECPIAVKYTGSEPLCIDLPESTFV